MSKYQYSMNFISWVLDQLTAGPQTESCFCYGSKDTSEYGYTIQHLERAVSRPSLWSNRSNIQNMLNKDTLLRASVLRPQSPQRPQYLDFMAIYMHQRHHTQQLHPSPARLCTLARRGSFLDEMDVVVAFCGSIFVSSDSLVRWHHAKRSSR